MRHPSLEYRSPRARGIDLERADEKCPDSILDDEQVELVRALLIERPDATLPELREDLNEKHGIAVSVSTMGRVSAR